jgi:hypothetical protein
MPANYSAHQEFETTLLQRIASSERFKIYQDAFRTATGLPLRPGASLYILKND